MKAIHRTSLQLAFLGVLSSLVGAPGVAQAQPVSWEKLKTPAFVSYLPKGWRDLGSKGVDPKKPWLGTWRYASPNASIKVFVRVVPAEAGPLDKLFDKYTAKLKEKAAKLTQTAPTQVHSDDNERDLARGVFHGFLNRRNPKTKKVEPAEHLIVRFMQRYNKAGLMFILTYLGGGQRSEELMDFIQLHLPTCKAVDSLQELKWAELHAKAKKPVPAAASPKKDKAGDALLVKPTNVKAPVPAPKKP